MIREKIKKIKKIVLILTTILLLFAITLVCPSVYSQTEDCTEVWFGPSIGSEDMLELFTNPTGLVD